MKVTTYNIRHGTDIRGEHRLDDQVQVINKIGPDVLFLQEVDCNTNRSNKIDQVDYFKINTELHYDCYCPTLNYDDGLYGIAILSKFPIYSSIPIIIPFEVVKKEPRYFLHVCIPYEGKVVNLFCTHFPLTLEERLFSIHCLKDYINENEISNIVLAGDFNFGVEQLALRKYINRPEIGYPDFLCLSRFFNHIDISDTTCCNDGSDSMRDYIFFDNGFTCTGSYTVDEYASDHKPVVAKLKLNL